MATRSSAIDISAEDNASEVFDKIEKHFDRMANTMERAWDISKKLAVAFVGFEAAKHSLEWLHEGAKKAAGDGTFTNYEKALAKVGGAWDTVQQKLGSAFDGIVGGVLERLEPIMDRGIETMFRLANVTTEVLFPALGSLFDAVVDVFFHGMGDGAKSAGTANNTILAGFKKMAEGVLTAFTVIEQAILHWDSAWELAVTSVQIQLTKLQDGAVNAFRFVVNEFETMQEIVRPSQKTLDWEKESREKKSLWEAENRRPDLTGMTDEKRRRLVDELNSRDPRKRVYQNQTTDVSELQKKLDAAASKVFGDEFGDALRKRLGALGAILGAASGIAIPGMRDMRPQGDPDGGAGGDAFMGGRGHSSGGNVLASHYLTGSNPNSQLDELKKANEFHRQHLHAVVDLTKVLGRSREERHKSVDDFFNKISI